jgi:hypothetical protein
LEARGIGARILPHLGGGKQRAVPSEVFTYDAAAN